MIDLPIKPSFIATKNGSSQNTISDATWTKLTFTTALINTGVFYDTTNSKWTPPAGKIFIGAKWIASSSTIGAGLTCGTTIYKNNSPYFNFNNPTIVNYAFGNVYMLDQCNGGDYFEIYAYADLSGSGTNTWNCDGSAASTIFYGHWIAQ